MRQSQLAVQSNGKRGFDSYYCYKLKGEADDYIIIIYYYNVHQSELSIVLIAVDYQPTVRIGMAMYMAGY